MFGTMGDAPSNAGGLSGCAEVIAAALPQAIGEIEAVIGSVAVTSASGAVTQVKVGDPVYQHDTIETGADGAVSITFTDGTAFKLSNNAHIVLNEFVFDSEGTSNSVLFSLAQGAFTFIAGKAANTVASGSIPRSQGSEAPGKLAGSSSSRSPR